MTENLKDLVTKKANASVVGVKERQMEKYAQATNQAVDEHGDELTYLQLINKLDSAYVEEKDPEVYLTRNTNGH